MAELPDEVDAHGEMFGVTDVYWDNLGQGWRMSCICGWVTIPCERLGEAGDEMEAHWYP